MRFNLKKKTSNEATIYLKLETLYRCQIYFNFKMIYIVGM